MIPRSKTAGIALIALAIVLLVLLVFVKLDVDEQGQFLCKIVEENPDLSMEQCPAHGGGTSWLILVAFGVSFLILLAGVILLLPSRQQKPQREFKDLDLSSLDAEEKMVYQILRQHNGAKYQSELMKETGFSKVKMTRILDRMTAEGILDRQRRGMTNLVVLK
ncbi:hypothetical protein HYS47_00560 [Candidatus Woesearchaeota archaeon]|nr:hypothetical protein [Candidatus Woesearchaeota archaeon]